NSVNDPLEFTGKRVGWLLTELEHQAGERVSEETRKEILQEVSAHIDSALQARLELGMDPIEAEREAVEQFGPPSAYLDELLRVHERASLA
ncbi:permease prefix domain 1-containing protein, partial [Acinetobacter baumannii]